MTQDPTRDALAAAIVGTMSPLLEALEILSEIGRRLHPPAFATLIATYGAADQGLRDNLDAFSRAPWPDRLTGFRDQVLVAADLTAQAYAGLRAAAQGADTVLPAYRAMRFLPRAMEALFPLAAALTAVSQFFLEPGARADEALVSALAAGARKNDVGLLHADNERGAKGGFSLFVPETYDAARPHPLIVALHGGSGHGRDFLWTWAREARTRGAILLSPTSAGPTWSLMGPDIDSEAIETTVARIQERWTIDPSRLLLTGMSDGGTFTYVSGLRETSPFTHLAPVSAAFHPMLAAMAAGERLRGLPIYVVHGTLDWMFAAEMAREAASALQAVGATVIHREIADLSHTYPREENPSIMDWFLG